jgi:hypothetical protein
VAGNGGCSAAASERRQPMMLPRQKTYRAGQIVKYANPQAGEQHLTFSVVEDNGDRALIESRDFPGVRFVPRETVAKDEITLE